MRATFIGDREDDLLQGLPWQAQLIYIRVLRRLMDDQTGFSGMPGRVPITITRMMEALFVEPRCGRSSSGSPDRFALNRSLKQLESCGLVERKLNTAWGSMVFFLPVAFQTLQEVGYVGGDNRPVRRSSEPVAAASVAPVNSVDEPVEVMETAPVDFPVDDFVFEPDVFPDDGVIRELAELLPESNAERFMKRFGTAKPGDVFLGSKKVAPKTHGNSTENAPVKSGDKLLNIGEIIANKGPGLKRLNFGLLAKVAHHKSEIRDLNTNIYPTAGARAGRDDNEVQGKRQAIRPGVVVDPVERAAKLEFARACVDRVKAEAAAVDQRRLEAREEYRRQRRICWAEDLKVLAELEQRPALPDSRLDAVIARLVDA